MSEKRQNKHITTLAQIFERAPVTAAEVGINSVEAIRLEQAGLIKRAGVVHTGHRGRPAIKWRLTDKARKRVKRAQAAGRLVTA